MATPTGFEFVLCDAGQSLDYTHLRGPIGSVRNFQGPRVQDVTIRDPARRLSVVNSSHFSTIVVLAEFESFRLLQTLVTNPKHMLPLVT